MPRFDNLSKEQIAAMSTAELIAQRNELRASGRDLEAVERFLELLQVDRSRFTDEQVREQISQYTRSLTVRQRKAINEAMADLRRQR